MNDKYLNNTGLAYYHSRLETLFPSQTDFEALDDKVDQIIAEGGEPNVIETVKVNNTALTPDANKAVNIDLSGYAETSDIPTDLSDLTNTGQDPYATEGYVDQNGGKIDSISIDGTTQTIDANKNVALNLSAYAKTANLPTKVSDLTNDSGFITNTVNNLTNYYTKSETYTKAEVDAAIGAITSLNLEVVQTLPTQDISQTTIYLVPKSTSSTNNSYDEYINTTGTTAGWELIGSTDIDLSDYWNSTNLVAITTSEIDTIISGS